MFIRFRQTKTKLQVSLIETRRIDGKVRHEHIAQLGSVALDATIADRIKFWQRLHDRLARLSNRIDAAAYAKFLGDIHARVPMVTPDEQRKLQRENAEADSKTWSQLGQLFAEQADGHKQLSAEAGNTIADAEAKAGAAAQNAKTAMERIERLDKGESVEGGLNGASISFKEILRQAGWTNSDMAGAMLLAKVSELGGEPAFEEFLETMNHDRTRWEKRRHLALLRTMLRRLS